MVRGMGYSFLPYDQKQSCIVPRSIVDLGEGKQLGEVHVGFDRPFGQERAAERFLREVSSGRVGTSGI